MTERILKCPLCEETVPEDHLRAHVESENGQIRNYVLRLIRQSHPEWLGPDGRCPKCWEYYASLSSVLV